jgi:type IV secretory pathway VirB3-like protein
VYLAAYRPQVVAGVAVEVPLLQVALEVLVEVQII